VLKVTIPKHVSDWGDSEEEIALAMDWVYSWIGLPDLVFF
jgi:hypothetical protein